MTRSGLAYQVAMKLDRYLNSMAVSSRRGEIARRALLTIEPQQRPFSVGESTPEMWKIGEGFMRLDHMFLVRLESVSIGSWQPEIWIVDPTA